MQYEIRTLDIGNGITLPYYEKGDLSGRPVIFLHGVSDSLRSFDRVAPHISDSLRAIFITQRGHGDASRPPAGYASADLAGDLAAFMDRLDIPSAVIVGHSMGSFAAQRFAIDHSRRVDGLVLVGSFPTCRTNAGVTEFYDAVISQLVEPMSIEFMREFQSSTFARGVPERFLNDMVVEGMKVPVSVFQEACREMIRQDHTEDLSKISAPCLLIWGDEDAYFDRSVQDVLLAGIRGSRLIEYKGVGHSPHWEAPERLADDVNRFVDQIVNPAIAASAD